MKKFLIMMMCVIMVVCFMPTVAMAETDPGVTNGEGGPDYVIRVEKGGSQYLYTSLRDAVKFAPENESVTITLLDDVNNGDGVVVGKNKNIIFNFDGHVYTVTQKLAGSSGYESQCFQLLENSTVIMNNGTIKANNADVAMLIQNYSNLTLNGMTLDGKTMTRSGSYALSNNNGVISINNGTTINSAANEIAMDVCWAAYYENGARVTVNDGAVINGTVELGLWGKSVYSENQSVLTVNGGTINGKIKLDDTITADKVDMTIEALKKNVYFNGGTFSDIRALNFLTNENTAVIKLSGDLNLSKKLTIDKPITIDGNDHAVSVNADLNDHLLLITANATIKNVVLDSANKAKGVQVYSQSTPVTASFDGVTFGNSKGSGLTVNGATVSLKDAAFTGNRWQDVNVDSGVGVNNDSILNVGTGCTFSHDYQITSDGQKGDDGKYGKNYGMVTLNDSAKTLAEKTVDVSAKDNSGVDYTYQKKVWTISDKPNIPPYVPTTPTTPTDNVTNSGSTAADNASTNADLSGSTSTSNGTTTATVDKTTADKIVDKAVENKSTEVVIDATANTTTAANSTTVAQVTIPTETLGAIAEKTEADVTIKTDVAEVKMDNTAAAAVSEQATGDTVQIIAEKVAEETDKVEFELKVVCSDGKVISNFNGGNIAVTVALPKAMAEKKVVCVYIDDNGHMSKVEGQKNADGTYTFVTGHFSSYVILSEEEADAAIAAQKEAIKNIKIKLTSKQVKTKSGKKGIKITWTAAAGDKTLDGVEVFRSKERNKGYGTEPFYTSTKGGNEGSYINTKSLKKGTRYYYRVRGYVLVDGQKVYTDYSTKAWRTFK